MPLAKVLAPLSVAVPTAGTTGEAQLAQGYPVLELTLRVLSLTGTVARARVETSDDAVYWDEIEPAPTQVPLERTSVGKATLMLDGAKKWVRLRLEADDGEVAGVIQARALQVYGSLADLSAFAVDLEKLAQVPIAKLLKALAGGSDVASSYLRKAASVDLPLKGWGDDLAEAVAKIAAYNIESTKGYQPTSDQENELRKRYKDALAWLSDVRDGKVALFDPDDLEDETPFKPMPDVYSDPPWGFQ